MLGKSRGSWGWNVVCLLISLSTSKAKDNVWWSSALCKFPRRSISMEYSLCTQRTTGAPDTKTMCAHVNLVCLPYEANKARMLNERDYGGMLITAWPWRFEYDAPHGRFSSPSCLRSRDSSSRAPFASCCLFLCLMQLDTSSIFSFIIFTFSIRLQDYQDFNTNRELWAHWFWRIVNSSTSCTKTSLPIHEAHRFIVGWKIDLMGHVIVESWRCCNSLCRRL